jgi:hypothetical protein
VREYRGNALLATPDNVRGDLPALREVAGIGEHRDVLAQGGLADVQQGQQGTELDLADRLQGRADPRAKNGVAARRPRR